MIILKLRCGLGNQFFEYACARALMYKTGEKHLYIDKMAYNNEPDNRKPTLLTYNLPDDTVILDRKIDKIRFFKNEFITKVLHKLLKKDVAEKILKHFNIYEANFDYIDIEKGKKMYYLQGIFQNINYFKNITDELKKIYLNFPLKDNVCRDKLIDKIKKENAVCVHIRRGDYVNVEHWKKQLMVCDNRYYDDGMKYISSNVESPRFYIFSNSKEDIEWIKENYIFTEKVNYIDMNNSDIDDFAIMCSCKHFILSNSSFSWWAQFLGKKQDSIVVAPKYWDTDNHQYDGIYIDEWVVQ